ncbi:MAG: acetolactate synthase [Chloroflexi bacterium]|nr:acetolactate synthase [Chloroflexota bacterium]
MPYHGGRLIARVLKNENVSHLFTLCGGHIAPIYDGCLDEGIAVVDTRHEQAAAHAADAYARLTRGIGVAAVTAGPGVTDAVTAVANAYYAASPLVLLGGAAPLNQQGRGALQEMEQVALLKPITKWSVAIHETARIPELLTQAIRVATGGRPGPVFIELPFDILFNFVDESQVKFPTQYRTTARAYGDPLVVAAAARLIAGAQRPVLLAGMQVYWDDASDILRSFSERTAMPVYTSGMGRGTLPMDHPHCLQLSRGAALREADLVIAVGTPMDFRVKYGEFGRETKVIQIDVDPTEIGRNRPVEAGIAGSAGAVLGQLSDAVGQVAFDAWLARLQGIEEEKRTAQAQWEQSDERPIHQLRLARELNRFIDEDTIVIGDGGDIVGLAAKVLTIRRPGRWMDPGPLGCLGVGLPFALAAQLLHPDKKVIVLNGDGSFALNGMEFDTAVRFNLPIVTLIGNDGQWGEIRVPQVALMGEERAIATRLAPGTRYEKIAEAFGGYGELVEAPGEIVPALQRAFASHRPAIINVLTDPDGVRKADAVRAYVM